MKTIIRIGTALVIVAGLGLLIDGIANNVANKVVEKLATQDAKRPKRIELDDDEPLEPDEID